MYSIYQNIMNTTEVYKCNECNKNYSCYRTLWNHNKKFHENRKTILTEIQNNITYECRICNKEYKHKESIYKHEKNCSIIKQPSIELEVEKTKIEVEKMKQETIKLQEKMKQKTIKLQIKLQGMKRIDNKSFKYINKMLMNRGPINNTINNTINNHYHFPKIMALGNENLLDSLTLQEKTEILDRRLYSLETIVEMVHCGSHNMFKNILITNLKDKFAYRYDESKGYFITTTKNDVLDDLVANRMMDIEDIYDELSTANKIDAKTKQLIQKFLNKMECEDIYIDETVEYPNFKSYKMNNIKILLYNNNDKITQDIALLIGENTNLINDINTTQH